MDEWISVKEKLPIEEGKVEVCFLEPFFGKLSLEITFGYYDNPDDYEDGGGKGWLTWDGSKEILVTHWKKASDKPESRFDGMDQKEFEKIFKSFRPNLGSVY